jgi:predicted nucleic acid-binding protein
MRPDAGSGPHTQRHRPGATGSKAVSEYYLDASALVKRYADEPGSAWILEITEEHAQHTILLSEITLAEVAAALSAKQRAPDGITLQHRERALSHFCKTAMNISSFCRWTAWCLTEPLC